MSQYNFDELVKKATHGKDTYCDKTTPISKTEAIKDILNCWDEASLMQRYTILP